MRRLLSFVGFIMIIVGTYCPLLRPFHLFNWDVYALNKPYGVTIFVIAAAGLTSVIASSRKLSRALAWVSVLLIILLYLAAIMKVNTTFSFIPFKGISKGLVHLIKFKWGWLMLFVGALFAVAGNLGGNKKIAYKKVR